MSTNKTSGNSLIIAAVAALVGFGAVYATMRPHDNAASPSDTAENAPKAPEAAKSDAKGNHMAAFVTKKTPEALPDITFTDGNGKELKLSDFKGRTVLLNLWATWCAPCREEMPALNRLQQELGSDSFEV
ncbi:MAG TPA: redoxin family protein, partial [Hyphomicrobium sp.]|nr:redoxin family protein [Hyphomicrobium sp.]